MAEVETGFERNFLKRGFALIRKFQFAHIDSRLAGLCAGAGAHFIDHRINIVLRLMPIPAAFDFPFCPTFGDGFRSLDRSRSARLRLGGRTNRRDGKGHDYEPFHILILAASHSHLSPQI